MLLIRKAPVTAAALVWTPLPGSVVSRLPSRPSPISCLETWALSSSGCKHKTTWTRRGFSPWEGPSRACLPRAGSSWLDELACGQASMGGSIPVSGTSHHPGPAGPLLCFPSQAGHSAQNPQGGKGTCHRRAQRGCRSPSRPLGCLPASSVCGTPGHVPSVPTPLFPVPIMCLPHARPSEDGCRFCQSM